MRLYPPQAVIIYQFTLVHHSQSMYKVAIEVQFFIFAKGKLSCNKQLLASFTGPPTFINVCDKNHVGLVDFVMYLHI